MRLWFNHQVKFENQHSTKGPPELNVPQKKVRNWTQNSGNWKTHSRMKSITWSIKCFLDDLPHLYVRQIFLAKTSNNHKFCSKHKNNYFMRSKSSMIRYTYLAPNVFLQLDIPRPGTFFNRQKCTNVFCVN